MVCRRDLSFLFENRIVLSELRSHPFDADNQEKLLPVRLGKALAH